MFKFPKDISFKKVATLFACTYHFFDSPIDFLITPGMIQFQVIIQILLFLLISNIKFKNEVSLHC